MLAFAELDVAEDAPYAADELDEEPDELEPDFASGLDSGLDSVFASDLCLSDWGLSDWGLSDWGLSAVPDSLGGLERLSVR